MIQSIWKFKLHITDIQHVQMPMGAKILSVANLHGNVVLYALVDPHEQGRENRLIEIIGTGNPIQSNSPVSRNFIGTVVADPFVWHVFERDD